MIRAFQWDLARQVERLDWLLAKLPLYADWGYQQLYLHLEDAIEYPSLPEVARRDAYRFADIERLVNRASRLGISVVPIVNLLGHTQYLIKTERLRDLNELRTPDGGPCAFGQLCPVHPETPRIAELVIRDVLPLCTAGLVHTGLDESFQLGRHPLSAKEISEVGIEEHFARYVRLLASIASSIGLRMGMWADMLALLPGAIPLLPRGISAYDWYYYPFERVPRLELRNFAEYDLAPALARQGIDYWGCPSNGAFRYEPMPVFGDRLGNILSWWRRCVKTGATGFLSTSWESYRMAQEMTTVVDAAAASLWLNPGIDHHLEMLAHGFRRVFGAVRCHEMARLALACDERAFTGYARWEINERWDLCSRHDGPGRYERDARFFERSGAKHLPESFASSLRFARYLAERDAFVRRAAQGICALRRILAQSGSGRSAVPNFSQKIRNLKSDAAAFLNQIDGGLAAARAMWTQSRDARRRGQNERILIQDRKRLHKFLAWLARVERKPANATRAGPISGAWQLDIVVHNFAPALQRVVVECLDESGEWVELRGRYTIEFRARAARPRAHIQRSFSVPVDFSAAAAGSLRLAVRGLGQVGISHVELTDGVVIMHPRHWPQRERRTLGVPAPSDGFPSIDMSRNRAALALEFDLQRFTRETGRSCSGGGHRSVRERS